MRIPFVLGPLLVLLGGIGTFVISLRTWYAVDLTKIPGGGALSAQVARSQGYATTANGWEPWGTFSDLLLFLVIAIAVFTGVAGLTNRRDNARLAFAAAVAGLLGIVLNGLHLISEPEPSELVTVRPVAWLSVVFCGLVLLGGGRWFDTLAIHHLGKKH
ncbi:unannotated protein [freshwater metagenome]|uniref:Unannotated protein n=1 Tax=freshwater metagenome TaxID=449393 RepID=A0A6J7DL72_9ZZZZ|nr:hypothetical protein [Actinomycetota bacterium]